ncbi:hypothetical protein [Flavobacterium pectinovorum]|uniref:HNH endonuclease n=1 Tax=Flavobacterium pectinovorum TaxID=29533 RepID=A0AB36NXB1_9FLAO|nr:hypothetical protein [Flavobacterium pectinovorum]OXB02431.1 hypothetical protein B0A72_17450 [Flavobacterium pectinovorum]SHM34557.1 hypothetical protein SAMN05444387_2259 [Flavobacterium pectinovorum]
MNPDFSKNTIDTLAKRAAFMCSNPDCRILTVGPNSDPEKSTKIGEAAHIYGARIGSKRFIHTMTNPARAEITNSIWLCRNCHKLIDTDEHKYFANILFAWREKHEGYIASSLGNSTDLILYEEQNSILIDFNNYSPIIKRIIIDKPDGWEFRLTAELMRFLNDPLFRKLNDLKKGLYLKPLENINSDQAFNWIQERLAELTRISTPAVGLLDSLTKSWGEPGESGDLKEIHHVTKLIKEYLEHVIAFEERILFVNVPKEYEKAVHLLQNLIGSQAEKLSIIPLELDAVVSIIQNPQKENDTPTIIKKEIIFEIPDSWQKEFNRELNKLQNKQVYTTTSSSGCFTTLIVIIGIIMFLIF